MNSQTHTYPLAFPLDLHRKIGLDTGRYSSGHSLKMLPRVMAAGHGTREEGLISQLDLLPSGGIISNFFRYLSEWSKKNRGLEPPEGERASST